MRRSVFFIVILVVYLLHIFWSQRAIFTNTFDPTYWKERFETSQWVLPLSERIIGDDGLYLTEGYRLIGGGDPSTYNAEMPPLGKYLIGASILLFSNGNVYGYIVTLFLVGAVWYLAKRISGSTAIAWASALLFATDPLVTGQFSLTMLDSLQSLFLVLYLIGLYMLMAKRTVGWSVVSGILLGLFAGSKAPLLVPVVLTIGVVAILHTTKRLQWVFLYGCSALLTYLSLYIPYFFHGHSLIDWFKLQKWIISFYLSSKLEPNFGSVFTTLLFNQTKNLFSDAWYTSSEWTFVWPLILVLFIASFVPKRRVTLLTGTLILLLFVFAISPFWVRYLILILPFLYISATLFIHARFSKIISMIIISVGIAANMFFSWQLLYPTAQKDFHQFATDWEHGFFHDMRERFTSESKQRFQRTDFQERGLTYLYDAQIEALDVRYDPKLLEGRLGDQIELPIEIAYRTRYLGEFVEHTSVRLIRENNQWRISWDWGSFMKDLMAETTIKTTVVSAKRGTLSRDGDIVSDFDSDFVSITPAAVDPQKEQEMLIFLSELFADKLFPLAIHERYIANSLPHRPRAIGVIPKPISAAERARLLSFSGITLTPRYGRATLVWPVGGSGRVANALFIECCSLLYSTTAYDGTGGLEEQYNSVLKGQNGGSIILYNENGGQERVVVSQEKRDGSDVTL